jgi:hypothetical protein
MKSVTIEDIQSVYDNKLDNILNNLLTFKYNDSICPNKRREHNKINEHIG